jgi:hypothetical protein
LFERIVSASQTALFGPLSHRFGWPREPLWPTAINERIERLGELTQLRVENLEGKTHPADKDRGLDVLGRWEMACDAAGGLSILTQCAVGAAWRSKRGEPSEEEWRGIYDWDSARVRAVAVPFRLEPPWDRRRVFAHFGGAIVLDRLRLMAASPDLYLEDATKRHLTAWCEGRLGLFAAAGELPGDQTLDP